MVFLLPSPNESNSKCNVSKRWMSRLLMRVWKFRLVPPMLSIPNQLEGAYPGQDVILECHTEAYPASINYWTTERGDMIISGRKEQKILSSPPSALKQKFVLAILIPTDTSRAGDKFETISANNGYSKFMKLKIRNVGPNDFGFYRCVAKNSLGK